jgi:hypothetical protein
MQGTDITGTWRLLSYEAHGSDGSVSYPLGRDAVGYIMYTDDGYMSVDMMASGRRSYADGDLRGGTDEEKLAAADSYVSYCGRFEMQDDSVLHHIEVAFFPNRVGTSQRRFIQLDGDRLLLTTPAMLIAGKEQVGRILWERAG